MQDDDDVLARWAQRGGDSDGDTAMDYAPTPVAAPVPPPAPPGFGYVWQPPYGFVMVSLSPQPPAVPPGVSASPWGAQPPAPDPHQAHPGFPQGPGPNPANMGGRHGTSQPQGSMLVKQGDRDPWDERLSQLPELHIPGVPPPGAYDAMEGRFNPTLSRELSQVQAEIRGAFPAASGYSPLEGSGTDSAGRVRHSRGSVGPLKG